MCLAPWAHIRLCYVLWGRAGTARFKDTIKAGCSFDFDLDRTWGVAGLDVMRQLLESSHQGINIERPIGQGRLRALGAPCSPLHLVWTAVTASPCKNTLLIITLMFGRKQLVVQGRNLAELQHAA